jgi:hypothetical protein
VRNAARILRLLQTLSRELGRELCSNPNGSVGVGKENRPQRNRARSCGDEFERITAGEDPSHADDRQAGRAVATEDGRERDRLQSRSGVAARLGAEHRLEGARVECEPPDRVHEREAVGACRLHGERDLTDVRCRRR